MMTHDPLRLTSVLIPFLCAVSFDASIGEAERLIATHDIVGIVTSRDLISARSGKQRRRELRVEDVDVKDIYMVDLRVPLATVGSAVVTSRGRLAGVFTGSMPADVWARYFTPTYRPQAATMSPGTTGIVERHMNDAG